MMMSIFMTVMTMQASARRAEKALQEILHKADHDSNGKVNTITATKYFTVMLTVAVKQ